VALIINTSTLAEQKQSAINTTFHWVCFILKHIDSNITVDIMDSSHTAMGQHILMATAHMLRKNLMAIQQEQQQRIVHTQRPNTSEVSQRTPKRRKIACSGKCPMDCLGDHGLN
jgi:hypothetical protein